MKNTNKVRKARFSSFKINTPRISVDQAARNIMKDKFKLNKYDSDTFYQSSGIEQGDVIKMENRYQSQPELFLKTHRLISSSSQSKLNRRFKKPTIQKHIEKVIIMDYSASTKIK